MSFKPVQVISDSIPNSLLAFAKKNSIHPKKLDFELISHQTLLQSIKSSATKVVETVSASHFRNASLNIIQKYTINIIPLVDIDKKLLLSFSASPSKIKASINIKKGSVFTDSPSQLKDLKNEIWKKKLKAGFLIDIFEDNLDTQLNKLLKIVPFNQALPKELKFTVAAGFLPTEPVDGCLQKIYEEKIAESDNLISTVKKNELIATYTIAKKATVGRTCDGKAIEAKKPKLIDKQPNIDDTITEKTSEDSIEYFASVDGYPEYNNNNLTISDTVSLQEANFKSTALIDSGNDDVSVSVKIQHNKSHNEDAIGSGVNIDVKELSVDGSIASNVTIETESLNVDAQTHKKSKMQVKDTANIKLHRGDLDAKDAFIDVLENGKVTASNSATIKQMLGGVVIAPTVKVGEVLSNTTIIASELIEIKSILGEHNKLVIDPDSIANYHNEIEEIQNQIKQKQEDYDEAKENLEKRSQEHSSQLDRIKTFKERVDKAVKSGKKPMKQDLIRVKQYKKEADKLSLEKENLSPQKDIITSLELELDKLCNKDLYAKIKSNTVYDGHTKVVFVNVKTREEISFVPEGRVSEIFLTLDENNERVISTK